MSAARRAVVIGASGGIGAALADALTDEGVAVTRLARSAGCERHLDVTNEASIATAAAAAGTPDLVIVATGLLHEGEGGRGPCGVDGQRGQLVEIGTLGRHRGRQ